MLVRLTNDDAITLDLPVDSVTWNAGVLREHGTATIMLPRTSPAWDSAYINEFGGFLVEAWRGESGPWVGIADVPEFSQQGAKITAFHITKWLEIRQLTRARTFYGFTPGAIAEIAFRDAMAGLGAAVLTLGPVTQAAPIIPIYRFSGQSVLACLTDMSAASGQEYEIVGNEFRWVASQGRYHEFHIVDDGRYISSYTRGSLQDMARETIEVQADGSTITVRADEIPALWPRQIITRPGS